MLKIATDIYLNCIQVWICKFISRINCKYQILFWVRYIIFV